MYRLHLWKTSPLCVGVVGCGGTGGFVAEGLCRFLPESARLVLIDHDKVEEHNLRRQNFYRGDINKFKSEALARRLSDKFKRPIAYSTAPISTLGDLPEIIVGCVDNGKAREDIANKITAMHHDAYRAGFYPGWYIDAGNGDNFGQILVGNRPLEAMGDNAFEEREKICYSLPLPAIQRPDLLLEVAPQPSCAEAVEQDRQSPTINQVMAGLVVDIVRKVIARSCSWMQLYVDMEAGTLRSILATPENVADLLKWSVEDLTYTERR